eukprot:TRINITY_DN9190_c0_g1_i2.p1 TRINITY_DN9190_c0_g1~~TRINITY_DN9190_c0_g1_i2.p1  ORF type:complete len:525 (-),score=88.22 TRINITY_DN9190_c0_g1_i2:1231-2805(-)
MAPIWSLGHLGSSMHYTDSSNPVQELTKFVQTCKGRDVPLDGFHLSSGYCASKGHDNKRHIFEWDTSRFSKPSELGKMFRENGVRLFANIKPALLVTHPQFQFASENGLFAYENGSVNKSTFHGDFWGGKAGFLDFTNPTTRAWWKNQVKEKILGNGVDCTWNDNNEFAGLEDALTTIGPVCDIRPVLVLLMLQTSFEAQKEFNPDVRPFVLSRSGGVGIQRFGQTWSGDNYTEWKSISFNVPMGLNLALCGVTNTGHDIGGFAGPKPGPELLVRWVYNGIFHPRFTVHSWNDDGSATELWMYPEVLPQIQRALKLRRSLLPILYTLMEESSRTGHPIHRPLVYHFQEDPHVHEISFDFLLGENILIPCVAQEGMTQREAYFPGSRGWFEFLPVLGDKSLKRGAFYRGKQKAMVRVPLDHPTFFVQSGSLIPLEQKKGELDIYLIVDLSQPFGEIETSIYSDDGWSVKYLNGEFSRVVLSVSIKDGAIECALNQVDGSLDHPFKKVSWFLWDKKEVGLQVSFKL